MISCCDFDTSGELLVQRWKGGVRLLRPESVDFYQSTFDQSRRVEPSISELFAMPFNVYFLNTQSIMINVSQKTAYTLGYNSLHDVIGTTVLDCFKKISAQSIFEHDHKVFSSQMVAFQDQYIKRLDNTTIRGTEIKFPLLDADGKVTGILGFTIFKDRLAESFHSLINSGLLAPTMLIEPYNSNNSVRVRVPNTPQECDELVKKLSEKLREPISSRECECLFYLIRGKSARETGALLNISQRTVEYYLDSLKDKINCRKKSEIMDSVFSLLKN